jgi:hypothetical protein
MWRVRMSAALARRRTVGEVALSRSQQNSVDNANPLLLLLALEGVSQRVVAIWDTMPDMRDSAVSAIARLTGIVRSSTRNSLTVRSSWTWYGFPFASVSSAKTC